jgi:hypothetical protein
MADPREPPDEQVRQALDHVRDRLLATRAQLHEKHKRMRQRQAELAERRRNSRR